MRLMVIVESCFSSSPPGPPEGDALPDGLADPDGGAALLWAGHTGGGAPGTRQGVGLAAAEPLGLPDGRGLPV